MEEKNLTPNVTLHEHDFDAIVCVTAHKDIFLNGKHPAQIKNDRTLTDAICREANASFGIVLRAIEKILTPKLSTSGHVPDIKLPRIESAEEFAKRTWPNNEEARKAFLLGCDFPRGKNAEWNDAYKKIHKEYALKECKSWAEQQEADITSLKALSKEEKQKVFFQRVVEQARYDQEIASRGPDY